MKIQETTQKTIERYFAALSRGDAKAVAACFTKDGVCRDPVDIPGHAGAKAIEEAFANIFDLFSVLTISARAIHTSSNHGTAVFWEGDGIGINGRKTWFSGIDIFTFGEGGLIAKLEGYWDPAPMLSTLKQPSRAMHKGAL